MHILPLHLSSTLCLKKSEMQEPSRALWSPRAGNTWGWKTGEGETSLSSQETAHGAKLIPRPSCRCSASVHPVLSPSSQPDTPTRSLASRPIAAPPKSSEELPAGGQALPWTGPRSPQAGQRPAGARAVAEGRAGAPGEGACSPGTPSLTCPAQAGTSGTRVAGEAPGTCGGPHDITSAALLAEHGHEPRPPPPCKECPSAQGHTARQDSKTDLSCSESAFTDNVYSKRRSW